MRVTRSFAFLDLCGFTAYTEAHGDDAAVAVLSRLRVLLRAEAERRGVRVTKWLGDGVMLSGLDAEAVVACSAAVRDDTAASSPLPLRGGIAEGAVIMFEGDDYVGAAPNLAARLCHTAGANQILVEAEMAEALAGTGVATRPLPSVQVPGLAGLIAVHEVPGSGEDRQFAPVTRLRTG
jgi:adenylate cyclase